MNARNARSQSRRPLRLALLCLAAAIAGCRSPGNGGEMTVVIEGLGATEEEARNNALVRAVEKALGEEVHSVSTLENGEIKEVVKSLAAGHVHNAEVLSVSRTADGACTVRMIADVRAGMLVAAFRSDPKVAASVLVPEADRWRDEAVSLRRANAAAHDFASLILDVASTFAFEATMTTPRRAAIDENHIVLESTCTVTLNWAEWDRKVVQPMRRLLKSLRMPSGRMRGTFTEHIDGSEPEHGVVKVRRFEGGFDCNPAARPLLLVDNRRSSELFAAPPGVIRAMVNYPRQSNGLIPASTVPTEGGTVPDQPAVLVLDCLDADGMVILTHRVQLPTLVLLAGRTEEAPAALLAKNCFLGVNDALLAIGDLDRPGDKAYGRFRFWRFDAVSFTWRWNMNDQQLSRFREVRARVE